MKNIMIRCLAICVVLLAMWHENCWGLGATDILDRVQKRYGTGGFEADFVQEAHLKAMGIVDTATGHLYFGTPGTMRWHYKTPEEYLIITDGDAVWIYRPEENQVMVGRAVDYFEKGADFLSKPAQLSKEFKVALAPEELQEEEHYVLKLVPKTEMASLTELYLYISKETFDIKKTVTDNAFGDRSIIMFDNHRFGQGLSSSLFQFRIPKDAEVLQLQVE